MKVRYALVLLLAFALMTGVACFKTTGGGWFFDDQNGNKITFGFTAHPARELGIGMQEVKGKFQLVDHGTKTRIHGTFTYTAPDIYSTPTQSFFHGPCTVNKDDGYYINVVFYDRGEPAFSAEDEIEISIIGKNGRYYHGFLQGGNIQIHKNHKK